MAQVAKQVDARDLILNLSTQAGNPWRERSQIRGNLSILSGWWQSRAKPRDETETMQFVWSTGKV